MEDRSPERQWSVARRAAIEGIGTALLLAMVVGSGIMAERLSGGDIWKTLLANSLATGAGLIALIVAFGPISGAHFNPLVTLAIAATGRRPWREVPFYIFAQTLGAVLGVAAANRMFEMATFSISGRARHGIGVDLAEFAATIGLIAIVLASSRGGTLATALAVGSYIGAAYWFTSSTSFANPAVTLGRSLTNTFTGIRPIDVPAFVLAQLTEATAAVFLFRWLEGGKDGQSVSG